MNLPDILRDVPRQFSTPRLVLRSPQAGDGAPVHEAVVETLGALRAWPASLPWALAPPTAEASEIFCRDSAAAFLRRTELVYLVFDDTGRLVGNTSLHHIDWAVPRFEVGYWVRSSAQRQGIATEAVSALVGFAFDRLGAQRVDARPDEANAGSRAVCEAAGMTLEGVLRHERITPAGALRNTCVYARVRTAP